MAGADCPSFSASAFCGVRRCLAKQIDEEELEKFFSKKTKTKKATTKKSNGRKRG
jgi:hypothetical protein